MEWVRLYTSFHDDEALAAAGEPAEVLFTRGMSYAGRKETGGFISDAAAKILCPTRTKARTDALERVELWLRDDERGGWQIRSWVRRQDAHEATVDRRRAEAARQQRRRDKVKAESPRRPPEPPSSRDGSRDDSGPSRRDDRDGSRDRHVTGHVTGHVTSRSRESEREAGQVITPLTGGDAPAYTRGGPLEDLISQVRAVRPFWSPHDVDAAARACADAGRSYDSTLAALLAIAQDPQSVWPSRVVADGPWWRSPTERHAVSTTDQRVQAGLALAAELAAREANRPDLRALPGGAA